MDPKIAVERAKMPEGTNKVLDKRTVETDNRNLLKLLEPGMAVLDVGCGSGSITKGIAEKVAPGGKVTGIDPGENLISLAINSYADIPGLQFKVADIYTYETDERYDVITSARVLQWLADPKEAIIKMKRLLKENGTIAILDYNHEKIRWSPSIPPEMEKFYDAFLKWREDAGFDNRIADNLSGIFAGLLFGELNVEPQFEVSKKTEAGFVSKARIWSEVAETRGHQLVKDKYITEEERAVAITAYDRWIANEGESMQLYLLAVEAKL